LKSEDNTGPIPFDPHRFRTAAGYYLAGRSPYPDLLIRRVAEFFRLGPDARVMDLGCGPGQLARGFAPLVGEVVAVDPEPEMLRISRECTAEAGFDNVRFIEGSSYDIDASFGIFQAVAIGRAFHWMDRPATLRTLDGLIAPGGGIALFDDAHLETPENAWRKDFMHVIEAYGGDDADRILRKGSEWLAHEACLMDSAFAHLERISVITRSRIPIARLLDRAFSLSITSPHRLGERVEKFQTDLMEALSPHAVDGAITEVLESRALLAIRPAELSSN
jgi:SAM-dependent methyltransferase